ncbi:hypothetical protein F2P81_003421 [Scophthalmus maximus]|uniref:Secreted protein n=1 Tax=Scophthalmus maximus TaxID=52904 RepID=A0A6A4TE61_SCOMX|nr:hypothetical protein F2P81_003421 [Scophthalmus maximus]
MLFLFVCIRVIGARGSLFVSSGATAVITDSLRFDSHQIPLASLRLWPQRQAAVGRRAPTEGPYRGPLPRAPTEGPIVSIRVRSVVKPRALSELIESALTASLFQRS